MARSVTYVSAAKLVSMARGNHRMAVIDVRDEERSYQAHIAGSHHFASGSFAARLRELALATSGKDTLVFHCALSQVKIETPRPSSRLLRLRGNPIPNTSRRNHLPTARD
ncbi:hypothetical protein ACQ4PT_017291 [Festuca glaucescens]